MDMASMTMTMTAASSTMSGMAMSTGTSSMSGMAMPTGTSSMSGMAMPTGTSSMPGMTSSSGGTMMGMSDMMMVFFTSTTTALYSTAWTPASTGQYAGTCIFLIILALVFRALVALRSSFPQLYARYRHRGDAAWRADGCDDGKSCAGPARGRSWAVEEAAPRAILDTILAGVSYLLMLAVMTMNVGYFLSILAGTFLGSFLFGHIVGGAVAH